ncbi:TPA: hypothetical protein NKB37_000646 [Vibrio parahaemolyticus]|nr:hypothetical protein [Vibrio parahaemolyticus]HCG5112290.1 hypothetical protein [Vibrio parahaemolyticus]HCG9059596.1 hypothetical protein [Vibrio parahaemolyticus]HCG9873700.1 hypothetical protein [Vibrio parahaemolyticus]
MKSTVFFAQYGKMEDNDTLWANCQICSDFSCDTQKAGGQVVKTSIVTDNDNDVAKRLVKALVEAQSPIHVDLQTSMKIQKGAPVLTITDFKLANNQSLKTA